MQFGFMPGKSTTDPVFMLRQVMKKYRRKKKKMHVVFVDLEKAYDRMKRVLSRHPPRSWANRGSGPRPSPPRFPAAAGRSRLDTAGLGLAQSNVSGPAPPNPMGESLGPGPCMGQGNVWVFQGSRHRASMSLPYYSFTYLLTVTYILSPIYILSFTYILSLAYIISTQNPSTRTEKRTLLLITTTKQ